MMHLDGYSDEKEEELRSIKSDHDNCTVHAEKSSIPIVDISAVSSEEISLDALLGMDHGNSDDEASTKQLEESRPSTAKDNSSLPSSLPSAGKNALSQSVLTFKSYADAKAAATDVKKYEAYNHIPASAHPSMTGKEKEMDSIPLGLPSIGWHVPLTAIHTMKDNDSLTTKKGGAQTNMEAPSKRAGQTVKEKEKLKRFKGQSSHQSWKPEEWMKMRQTFD
ncbi:hypothetical protein IE077_000895 [Cardiosporidium cionae]|uniref:Uncharacterized protein n=1 Tax=Cardiosporidium cionae TaxID=476202 RepID=A0ABQ7J692_9APIC|nr:hypothetical protein IE077_000895 [Cardiosporidium cionae]|eukprot:KAF8819521.1 hypothetical protein IE077_000895 [Cardiosporidium cionae]